MPPFEENPGDTARALWAEPEPLTRPTRVFPFARTYNRGGATSDVAESSAPDPSAAATTASPPTTAAAPRRSSRVQNRPPSVRDLMAIADAADASNRRRTRGVAQRQRDASQAERRRLRQSSGVDGQDDERQDQDRAIEDGDADMQEDSAEEEDSSADGAGDDDEEASNEGGADEEDEEDEEDTGEEAATEEDEEDTGSGPNRSRSRPVLYTPTKADVRVKPPKRFHVDWAAWTDYHETYCEKTMQVLPVKEVINWEQKAARTRATKGFKNGSVKLVPREWDPYQRTVICTHGWRKRKRGKGKRPRQHIRLTGCPFRFIVQACPVNKRAPDGPWHLEVKYGLFVHNHPVTPDTYGTYPSSRGVKDPLIAAKLDGMIIGRAKRCVIYNFLLENDQNVISKDVDNLIAAHSPSVPSVDDDDATAAVLAKFAKADKENVVTVDETAKLESGVISITTKLMRKVCTRFSEMLFIDCTHKTNRYNYQLMTFMVMNEYGEGMPVQQSLLEANGDWHMDRAIKHFKRANADSWKLLRVIMVDKDLNEIRVLRRHFPEACILICYFHVSKYLKEMSSKPDFGKISSDDKKTVDMVVGNMIRASTDAIYEQNRASLRGLCGRLDFMGYFDYMEKNWHTCQDMWVLGRRRKLEYFKNDTNNFCESYFGRFKDGVKSDFSMVQCVEAILAYARCKENDYKHQRDLLGTFVNDGYDEEMATVLRMSTHFVSGKVESQYAAGLALAEEYAYDVRLEDQAVIVRGPDSVSTVSTLDWSCDCEFAVAMKLPCRHVIAYRKHGSVPGSRIPFTRVDVRWMSTEATLKPTRQFEYNVYSEEDAREVKRRRTGRTAAERYTEAVRATHLIASELADIEDDVEFDQMVEFLQNQWRNVRQRRRTGPATDAPSIGSGSGPGSVENAQDRDEEPEKTEPSNPGVTMQSVAEDEESDGEAGPTQPAVIELSQTHSLWSEDVGHVPIVDPTAVRFAKAGSPALRNFSPNERTAPDSDDSGSEDTDIHVKLKLEGVKKRGGGDDDSSNDSEDDSAKSSNDKDDVGAPLSPVKINPKMRFKINTTTRRGGRKKTDHKQRGVDQAVEFVRFNAAEESRRELGMTTLEAIITSIYSEKPDLDEANRRLVGVTEKFTAMKNNTAKVVKEKNPLLNVDHDSPSCRFIGGVSATVGKKKQVLSRDLCQRVAALVREAGVKTILIPVNFGSAHWCGITIKVFDRVVATYDPVNQAEYSDALVQLGESLVSKVMGGFPFTFDRIDVPVQHDLYSCGVFVAWFFVRAAQDMPLRSMSGSALNRRRFEIFYYTLYGKLLNVDPPKPELTASPTKSSASASPTKSVPTTSPTTSSASATRIESVPTTSPTTSSASATRIESVPTTSPTKSPASASRIESVPTTSPTKSPASASRIESAASALSNMRATNDVGASASAARSTSSALQMELSAAPTAPSGSLLAAPDLVAAFDRLSDESSAGDKFHEDASGVVYL